HRTTSAGSSSHSSDSGPTRHRTRTASASGSPSSGPSSTLTTPRSPLPPTPTAACASMSPFPWHGTPRPHRHASTPPPSRPQSPIAVSADRFASGRLSYGGRSLAGGNTSPDRRGQPEVLAPGPVLHLPRMFEDVPCDPAGRVARGPTVGHDGRAMR